MVLVSISTLGPGPLMASISTACTDGITTTTAARAPRDSTLIAVATDREASVEEVLLGCRRGAREPQVNSFSTSENLKEILQSESPMVVFTDVCGGGVVGDGLLSESRIQFIWLRSRRLILNTLIDIGTCVGT